MTPSLPTEDAISATRPPKLVRISPRLTMLAWLPASPVKLKRPASQSLSFRRRVEPTKLATSTRAVAPKSTPLGFKSQTRPLLLSWPKICEGSLPSTRLSTWLLASACWKRTPWPAPMLKLLQLRMAPGLLATVIWLPWVLS